MELTQNQSHFTWKFWGAKQKKTLPQANRTGSSSLVSKTGKGKKRRTSGISLQVEFKSAFELSLIMNPRAFLAIIGQGRSKCCSDSDDATSYDHFSEEDLLFYWESCMIDASEYANI
jgi:hypothetical protein